MGNIIVLAILVLIVTLIVIYLWREKKRGNKCVGCPYAKSCSKKNNSKGCK